MAVETGILLESGTNELELLEFVVGNQPYGTMWQRLMNSVRIKSQRWCRMHMST